MSVQIFSRVLKPSLGRNVLGRLSGRNSPGTQWNKRNTLSRTLRNIRFSSSKSGTGESSSSFKSENVLMFTGLGLLGGVIFYVCIRTHVFPDFMKSCLVLLMTFPKTNLVSYLKGGGNTGTRVLLPPPPQRKHLRGLSPPTLHRIT